MPTPIVLATLNARYAHASLALRYLRANLGPLREVSLLCEFVLLPAIADGLGISAMDLGQRLIQSPREMVMKRGADGE